MILFLVYLFVAAVVLHAAGRRPPEPAYVVTVVWLSSLIMAAMPLVRYRTSLSTTTVVLVIASHLALVLGTVVARRSRRDQEPAVPPAARGLPLLVATTVLFIAVSVGSHLSSRTVPVVSAAQDLAALRSAYVLSDNSLSGIAAVERMLSYAALGFVVLLPQFARQHRRRELVLAAIGAVMIADSQLRLGGRADLVFALVAMSAVYFHVHRLRLRRIAVGAGVALGIFILLGGSFLTSRSANFSRNPEAFIAFNCTGADLHPGIADSSLNTKALVLSSCYFSAAMYNMDAFLADDDAFDFQYGKYNLGLLFREEFAEVREDTASYYRSLGIAQNPWATSVRDFWIDFGDLTPLAFFGMGFFLSRMFSYPIDDELALSRRALFVTWAVMIPFISPLIIPSLVYPPLAVSAARLVGRRDRTRRAVASQAVTPVAGRRAARPSAAGQELR